jgi:heme-degrading monooxygenase HmoA
MNRFKIVNGFEVEFEEVWKNRDTHLKNVKGFKNFNLIKGKQNEEYTLYASHSTWDNEEVFIDWTKSDAFRLAHKDAGKNKKLYIGHPDFEGFRVVI